MNETRIARSTVMASVVKTVDTNGSFVDKAVNMVYMNVKSSKYFYV